MNRLDNLRSAIRRLPGKLYDFLFELACRLLLPISTMCKVCNILRGMLLGFALGVIVALLSVAIFPAPGAH